MNKRRWYQFSVSLPKSFYDIISGQLSEQGFTGFVEQEESIECYIPAKKTKAEAQKIIEATLERLKKEFPKLRWTIKGKVIKEENWNKQWEKNTGIVSATSHIIIKPSWKKLRKKDAGKIVLHIDPKMSFGTGHHETTRLSLELLERYVNSEGAVLDFGCGTGVLAIAAAKLGARSIIAIDNDPWAIENAKENVKRNRVQNIVKVLSGNESKIPNRTFSLIVANIDVPTIQKVLPALTHRMKVGSIAIFSGILTSDGESLIPIFAKYRLSAIDLISENEWLAITLMKL